MSHISKIELEVKDLGILDQACRKLDMAFIRGQASFRWYGKESPCDHTIKVPGADYELGVIDKNGCYELNCDFYDRNLEKVIGKQGGLLKQAYAVEKTKNEARKKISLTKKNKIVLTVGNLEKVKGHSYLIESIEGLSKKIDDVLCVIVGGGKEYQFLKDMVKEKGLQDCVRLVGEKPHAEINIWMNACDIYVQPSLKESFGIVILEAMACGKPVIGTNVGGIPEIILDNSIVFASCSFKNFDKRYDIAPNRIS